MQYYVYLEPTLLKSSPCYTFLSIFGVKIHHHDKKCYDKIHRSLPHNYWMAVNRALCYPSMRRSTESNLQGNTNSPQSHLSKNVVGQGWITFLRMMSRSTMMAALIIYIISQSNLMGLCTRNPRDVIADVANSKRQQWLDEILILFYPHYTGKKTQKRAHL